MHNTLLLAGLLAAAALLAACASPQGAAGRTDIPGLHAFRSAPVDGAPGMPHTVWLPPGFDAARKADPARRWPLIIFFHGSGESGTDGSRQIWQGLGLALLHNPDRFDAIVVMPQKPDKREWDQLDAMTWPVIEGAIRDWPVDGHRVVLTGVSQGGKACWHFASQRPALFAAIAPVAARSVTPEQAAAIGTMPVWLSHGGQDPVIKIDEARVSVERLKAVGNTPRETYYPEAGHVSWHEFYGDPEVQKWLQTQRRP